MAKSLQAQQRELLSTAVDAADQIVMITGADQQIVYVNGAFTRVTGYTPDEALGRKPSFLQGPGTSEATRMDLHGAIERGHRVSAEILNYRKSGEPYWVDVSIVPVSDRTGSVIHWIAIERDITARKAQEQETARLAMEDHLTGLPNRRAAEARLQVEFSRAQREGSVFAIALMDVDRFKLVNDQHGHHAGDLALIHLAKLLARNMRGGDWIARWGGEEFLACLHALDARGAMIAGERARKLVRGEPVKLPQGDLSLTISAGIALCGPESDSVDTVVANADALLYQAKQLGRDQVLCAGAAGGRQRAGAVWEGSQVQTALREGRVVAAYQPIVDLHTGDVVGEEALARIIGSGKAPIPAGRFMLAAEQLRLAAAIDRTISQRALERMASPNRNGSGGAHFINLSAQFLGDPEQVSGLLMQARALGLLAGDANPVVIEITARQTGELAVLYRQLKPLVDEGFRLALDDFGSGNASFMYLTDLPMSFVKVEGWMVGRVVQDPRIRRLIESIVNTAARFELKTIAECVETGESADVLRDVGVDWAQGHFFAEPRLAA